MLQTLSQKAIWVNIIALIAALGTAFGFDLGLDAANQAEIVAGILAIVNVIIHIVQHGREKKAASGSNGGGSGSINTSMLIVPLLFAALFIGGCANMPTPQTPKQTLAYTESSYTAVVQTMNDLHDQGVLSASQDATIDTLVQQGNTDLEAAHAALDAGDTSTMQGRLAALDAVLVKLRTLLQQEASNGQ